MPAPIHFGLDVPIDARYAEPNLLINLATDAEQAGWDGFFIQDIAYNNGPLLDPTVSLAAIAARTKTIRLGIFMTALPRRRPWKLAREMLTLDLLSNGRVILGVGLGYQAEDYVPYGEEVDLRQRAEKLDEGLAIISALWAGGKVYFQGKHYQVDLPPMLPDTIQKPRIPIWVSGGWPRRKPFQRAAQWDGIYLMTVNQETGEMLTPAEVREIKAYILSNRKDSTPFDVAVNIDSSTDQEQRDEIARAYAEAGATWLIEMAPDDPQEYQMRIQAGPPEEGVLP